MTRLWTPWFPLHVMNRPPAPYIQSHFTTGHMSTQCSVTNSNKHSSSFYEQLHEHPSFYFIFLAIFLSVDLLITCKFSVQHQLGNQLCHHSVGLFRLLLLTLLTPACIVANCVCLCVCGEQWGAQLFIQQCLCVCGQQQWTQLVIQQWRCVHG